MLALVVYFIGIAQAATYYFSATGSDGTGCTQSSPCRSLAVQFSAASGNNNYVLGAGLFNETAVQSLATQTAVTGASEASTILDLSTNAASNFNVSSGRITIGFLTFTYGLAYAHSIVTINEVAGSLNFTNITINQSATSFGASVFNIIAGRAFFTNVTMDLLRITSTGFPIFGGNPVELFLNVCSISNVLFSTATVTPSIIYSTSAEEKSYYFNNTRFVNISATGNGASGGLFYFNSGSATSLYTYDSCVFSLITQATGTNGVVCSTGVGKVNFTLTQFLNIANGNLGCAIYSNIPETYVGRCKFETITGIKSGTIYIASASGALAFVSSSMTSLSSTGNAVILHYGLGCTIMDSNFTTVTGAGENTGVYMLLGTATLTLGNDIFQGFTGANNVVINAACPFIATSITVKDSKANGRPVAWFSSKPHTVTTSTFTNLTATGLSACARFTGLSVWNSCVFKHIRSNGNGGLCCQDGPIVTDNTTFLNITSGGTGGIVHWHTASDTFTRCIMHNCSAAGAGGALYFSNNYLLANCEFGGNKGSSGNDVYAVTAATEATIYGCCSSSAQPRLNAITNSPLLRDCTFAPRYVNTTARGGADTVSCGAGTTDPCLTLNHSAVNYINNTPLYLVVDYGNYPENAVILVSSRHIMVNGTTEVGKETCIIVNNNDINALFKISTGTLTINRLNFMIPRGNLKRAVIHVDGNGTMTVRDSQFNQSGSSLQGAVVFINQSQTVCVFENCVFKNMVLEDNSSVWIADAKSVDFNGCSFLNLSSVTTTPSVLQAAGGIFSAAAGLSMNVGRFVNCKSSRNGGAIYFSTNGGLSLTDIEFDRCTAQIGGALYIAHSSSSASVRMMIRCSFLNNIALTSTPEQGNDIKDLNGVVASWTGANAIDDCSISDFRKFSVGGNTADFDGYVPVCFKNPCLAYNASNCPPECTVSGGSCIADVCTRLHYETTCPATCMMHDGWCVPDRCYNRTTTTTCNPDHECKWDYPLTTNLSTGEQVIPNNTKVCQAVGECTRLTNETNCTRTGCTWENLQHVSCVPDKCYMTALTIGQCPQDCDWSVSPGGTVTCLSTKCTRQGSETICLDFTGECLLETSGAHAGRCTVDICQGRIESACTTECQWVSGSCKIHKCTTLHNETTCDTGCQMDKSKPVGHCVIDPCVGKNKATCPPECTWNDNKSTCTFNHCYRLNNESTCATGCQMDQANWCIVDPCVNVAENNCKRTDCIWNTAVSPAKCEYTACVRLHNETNCYVGCQKDYAARCVTDVCANKTQGQCATTDCTWSGTTCVFNNCTRLHNEANCELYDKCQLDQSSKCVPDPCPTKTGTTKDDCEGIDCTWNSTSKVCSYNSCTRLHNANGLEACYPGCQLDPKGSCVKDPCPTLTTNATCGRADCTWNTAVSPAKCEYNSCVRLRNESTCYDGCQLDQNSVCVPDVCVDLFSESACKTADCTWNGPSALKRCEYNKCVRLHKESTCYPGCQFDQSRICVTDVCVSKTTQNACHLADCTWNTAVNPAKCEYNLCVRLHPPETTCYPGCQFDLEKLCTKDVCAGIAQTPCSTSDCTWNNTVNPQKCEYHSCVRLHNEANCYDPQCKKDPQGLCAANPCIGLATQAACWAKDCIWENGVCSWNKCTRLHNEKNTEGCYDNCYKDPDQKCVLNPCSSKNQVQCTASDCLWNVSTGKCDYNKCVRLRGESTCDRYNDCKMDPDGRCRANPCTAIGSEMACNLSDCTWVKSGSTGTCTYNECTRLNKEAVCYNPDNSALDSNYTRYNCYPDPYGACVKTKCVAINNVADCNKTDCKWNTGIGKCEHNECERLRGEEICYDTCQMNPQKRCVHDVCLDVAKTPTACNQSDCTWTGSSCVYNKCVRLAVPREADCGDYDGCEKDPHGFCRADPCRKHDGNKANCDLSDCKWNSATSKCDYTKCVRLNSEADCYNNFNGTAPGYSNYECYKDPAGKCVQSPCEGLLQTACTAVNSDCTWRSTPTPAKCIYNDCVRLHNETACYKDSHCQLNPRKQCVPDVCDVVRSPSMNDITPCLNLGCTWNTSKNPAKCEYNTCVKLHGEADCTLYDGCELHQTRTPPRCYPDPCYNLTTEDQCAHSDCLWNKNLQTCSYNHCVRLDTDTACPAGCQLDRLGYCAHDPCPDITGQTQCSVTGDCFWRTTDNKCFYDGNWTHGCVRLHEEEKCYDGCAMDLQGRCAVDPCLRYSVELDCKKSDCSWNSTSGKCQWNPCVRYYFINSNRANTSDTCNLYSKPPDLGCVLVNTTVGSETVEKCIPNVCQGKSTVDNGECAQSDCTLVTTSPRSCDYNLCVRLYGATECPGGCVLKQTGSSSNRCILDYCVVIKEQGTCDGTEDCIWLLGNWRNPQSGRCVYNQCEDNHTHTTGCQPDRKNANDSCKGTPANCKFVPDICKNSTAQADCYPDCTWNTAVTPAKCEYNECVRSHFSNDCENTDKCKLHENVCLPDPCLKYPNNPNDCTSHDCTWVGSLSSNRCVYNKCVRFFSEATCYDGCQLDPASVCVTDVCKDIGNNEAGCNLTDCKWNAATGTCEYHTCVRLHNDPSTNNEPCYTNCTKDLDLKCTANPCTQILDKPSCDASECTWNVANSKCEVNKCVRLHNETECYVGCVFSVLKLNICVEDPCYNVGQTACESSDCTWNTTALPNKCEYNKCVRLEGDTACYSGCQLDPDQRCIEDPCPKITVARDCAYSDCTWDPLSRSCAYNHCTRLHNENGNEACYVSCALDPQGICTHENCTGINQNPDKVAAGDECKSTECTWNDGPKQCSYNKCVRLHNENGQELCYDGCQLDPYDKCVPDPCPKILVEDDCKKADCTWNNASPTKCTYNSCVRLESEPDCTKYSECTLDRDNICFHDPCPSKTTTECVASECTYDPNGVPNKCVVNPCVRLHNEPNCAAYTGCELDQSNRCAEDPCSKPNINTQAECWIDCTWNNSTLPGKCEYNDCVRLHDEEDCRDYPGCKLNKTKACTRDVCSTLNKAECMDHSECFYNRSGGGGTGACEYNQCVSQYDSNGQCWANTTCKLDYNSTCIPNTCASYMNEASCIQSIECRWDLSTSRCIYNPCVSYHNAAGDCTAPGPDGAKCVQNNISVCVPDVCEDYQARDTCEKAVECRWNLLTDKCEYNLCVAKNSGSGCVSNSSTTCVLSVNNICVPDTCSLLNETLCLKSNECIYDFYDSKCIHNDCVNKSGNVDACNGDSTCKVADTAQKCVTDLCNKYNPTQCGKASECYVNLGAGGSCEYNPCVTLVHTATQCTSNVNIKCISTETPGICKPDNCGSIIADVCKTSQAIECLLDSSVSPAKCEHNPCINQYVAPHTPNPSFNNNTYEYGSCKNTNDINGIPITCVVSVVDGTHDICVPNTTCGKYDNQELLCKALTQCTYLPSSTKCIYNQCVYQHDTQGNCLVGSGCELDYDRICVPENCNITANNNNSTLCENVEICVHNPTKSSCEYNPCIYKHDNVGMCIPNSGCVIDGRSFCVPAGRCASYVNASSCSGASECAWNNVNDTCEYNFCVDHIDKSGPENVCRPITNDRNEVILNCSLSKDPNVCVPDVCNKVLSYNKCEAISSCVWNSKSEECEYNPCTSKKTTDSGCVASEDPEVAIPDVCTTYNQTQCSNATECLFNNATSSSGCEYNPCVSHKNQDGKTCSNVSPAEGCVLGYKSAAKDVCVPNTTCSKYNGNKQKCEKDPNCRYIKQNSSCIINNCSTKHDENGACEDPCHPNIDGYCHPDTCNETGGYTECLDSSMCQWNAFPRECEINPCVNLHDAAGCTDVMCYVDNNGVCVKDLCSTYNLNPATCQNATECMYIESTGDCKQNPCAFELDDKGQCITGNECQLDNLSKCVPNPCFGLTEIPCGQVDCIWNTSTVKCETSECTRLHEEATCPTGCQMSQISTCVKDPCPLQTNQDSCENKSCIWKGSVCEYQPCVPLFGEELCYPGCLQDKHNRCYPDICTKETVKEACGKDCIWTQSSDEQQQASTCGSTTCTRVHNDVNDTECYNRSCQKDLAGGCAEDPCATLQTREDCDVTDCFWNGTACNWTPCVRLPTYTVYNDEGCYDGCVLFETRKCVVDPCAKYSVTDCTSECIVNKGKCQAGECTRLNGNTTCDPAGCQLVNDNCVPLVCSAPNATNNCPSGCKHNPDALTQCIADPCMQRTFQTCPQVMAGSPCAWIDDHCESVKECNLTAVDNAECRDGCVDDPTKSNLYCIPDPCANISGDLGLCGLTGDRSGFSCVQMPSANGTHCRADELSCTNPSDHSKCLEGCMPDENGKCQKNLCPQTSVDLCLSNFFCVLLGNNKDTSKTCIWNDCLEKPENKNASSAEEANCGQGCEYVITSRRCEPDACRPNTEAECGDTPGCKIVDPLRNLKLCVAHPEEVVENPISKTKTNSFPWWIFIIVAAVVLAIIAIIALFLMKRKKPTDDGFDFAVDTDLKDGEGIDIEGVEGVGIGGADFGFGPGSGVDDEKGATAGENFVDEEGDEGNNDGIENGNDEGVSKKGKKGAKQKRNMDLTGLDGEDPEAYKKRQLDPELDINFGDAEGLQFGKLTLSQLLEPLDGPAKKGKKKKKATRKPKAGAGGGEVSALNLNATPSTLDMGNLDGGAGGVSSMSIAMAGSPSTASFGGGKKKGRKKSKKPGSSKASLASLSVGAEYPGMASATSLPKKKGASKKRAKVDLEPSPSSLSFGGDSLGASLSTASMGSMGTVGSAKPKRKKSKK